MWTEILVPNWWQFTKHMCNCHLKWVSAFLQAKFNCSTYRIEKMYIIYLFHMNRRKMFNLVTYVSIWPNPCVCLVRIRFHYIQHICANSCHKNACLSGLCNHKRKESWWCGMNETMNVNVNVNKQLNKTANSLDILSLPIRNWVMTDSLYSYHDLIYLYTACSS